MCFDVHSEGLDCFVSLVAERTLVGFARDVAVSDVLKESGRTYYGGGGIFV